MAIYKTDITFNKLHYYITLQLILPDVISSSSIRCLRMAQYHIGQRLAIFPLILLLNADLPSHEKYFLIALLKSLQKQM